MRKTLAENFKNGAALCNEAEGGSDTTLYQYVFDLLGGSSVSKEAGDFGVVYRFADESIIKLNVVDRRVYFSEGAVAAPAYAREASEKSVWRIEAKNAIIGHYYRHVRISDMSEVYLFIGSEYMTASGGWRFRFISTVTGCAHNVAGVIDILPTPANVTLSLVKER